MANVFLLDYENVFYTIANFPWHSICRFLGQHQQMFKLFEKVLQTYCVKFSPLIFSFVCQRLPKSIHNDSNFRFLVKNFGRTASSMSHTGASQLSFMSTVTKIKDQSSVLQTMQQNINSTLISAATWETRRTLILGWNASPQGFRGLTKRTRQRWDLLKQNDQIHRSVWPRKNLKVFIDTEEMENDTLEEIYGLCRSVYSIDVDTHSLNCFFFQGQIATSPGST